MDTHHKEKSFSCCAISSFQFSMQHITISDSEKFQNIFTPHTHSMCEIYINISGNVSILIENNVYPVRHGYACVIRPGESHCSIYHDNSPHEHFFFLFSYEGNEKLLDLFFKRPVGQNNLLVLPFTEINHLLHLCYSLEQAKSDDLKCQIDFWRIIHILSSKSQVVDMQNTQKLSDITMALNYIDMHFTEPIDIKELSAMSHVSISTLERHFRSVFGVTPHEYIKQRRLAFATELLQEEYSVSEVATKCGFNDYSRFIALFKKYHGITPLKYQKYHRKFVN